MQRALRHAREKLAALGQLPEHGLIVFASESVCELLAPPMPVKSSYVCGKRFAIGELRPLFRPAAEQGLLTFCPRQVIIWKTSGTRRLVLDRINVDLQTDSARGGQSAPRFGRIRQAQRQALLKRICESVRLFLPDTPIVSGSGELVGEYCRLVGAQPIRIAATEANSALQETLIKAGPLLANQEMCQRAKNQALFQERLARAQPLLFGDEIREASELGTLRLVFTDGTADCAFAPEVVLYMFWTSNPMAA